MSVRRRFASPSTEKPRFLCLFQRKSPHNFCTKILHRTSCDRVGWSGCRLPQISPISTDKLHSACEESVFICRADDWQAPRWHLCSSVRSVGEKSTAWPIPPIPHLTLHVIDHPLPAKECRSAAPMARSVLLVSSPHGICVPQCDLWAYKTPAWPHSIIPHPTDHSTFHIPRSTFHVPHSTFHVPHSTFNIPRSTFNVQHSTFHVPHSTFHIPRSTFHVQHSTFHVQHSTFHIPHSTYHIINSFSRLVSEQPLRLGTYCGGSSHASPHHLWCLWTPKVRIPVPPNAVGQRFSPCSYHCFAMVT